MLGETEPVTVRDGDSSSDSVGVRLVDSDSVSVMGSSCVTLVSVSDTDKDRDRESDVSVKVTERVKASVRVSDAVMLGVGVGGGVIVTVPVPSPVNVADATCVKDCVIVWDTVSDIVDEFDGEYPYREIVGENDSDLEALPDHVRVGVGGGVTVRDTVPEPDPDTVIVSDDVVVPSSEKVRVGPDPVSVMVSDGVMRSVADRVTEPENVSDGDPVTDDDDESVPESDLLADPDWLNDWLHDVDMDDDVVPDME